MIIYYMESNIQGCQNDDKIVSLTIGVSNRS